MTTSPDTTREARRVLKSARDLLSDPARWTTGASARDKSGRAVNVDSSYAVCWCVSGAAMRSYTENTTGASVQCAWEFWESASMEELGEALPAPDVNDGMGYATTMRVLDRAIQIANAELEGV